MLLILTVPNSTNSTQKNRLPNWDLDGTRDVNESGRTPKRSGIKNRDEKWDYVNSIFSGRVQISTEASISRLGPGRLSGWLTLALSFAKIYDCSFPETVYIPGWGPGDRYTWPKRSWSSVSEALSFRILRPSHSVRAASPHAFAINFENLHLLHAHNFGRKFIAANRPRREPGSRIVILRSALENSWSPSEIAYL